MHDKVWGWTILALIGLGTLAIAAAFAFDFQGVSGFLWEVPVLFMATATIGGAGLSLGIQRSSRPRLVKLAVAVGGITWLLFILGLFNVDLPGAPDRWFHHAEEVVVLVISIFVCLMAALLPLLALETHTRMMRLLRRVAIITCSAAAIIWIAYYIDDQYLSWAAPFARSVLMFSSVTSLASVLLLPGGLLLSRGAVPSQPMRIAQVLCPRCGSTCDSADGDECTCAACALPIRLDRRDARCVCGYLLVNLSGNICPECGRSFAARMRFEMVEA